jgi:hypothetical protein
LYSHPTYSPHRSIALEDPPDPSIIKMTEGLVLDDPKLSVMDVSISFLAEMTLTGDKFYEAYRNFLKLLRLIVDDAMVKWFKDHQDFCLSHNKFMDNFPFILNFYQDGVKPSTSIGP